MGEQSPIHWLGAFCILAKTFMLKIIQFIEMYFLLGKVSTLIWWLLLILIFILYIAGKTYHNVKEEDGYDTKIFWYKVRSIVFILDILLIIGFGIYLLLK